MQLRLVKRSEAGLYTGTLAQLRHLLHHPAPLGSRAPARTIFSAVLDTDDNSDNSDKNSDDQPGQTLTVYKQSLQRTPARSVPYTTAEQMGQFYPHSDLWYLCFHV